MLFHNYFLVTTEKSASNKKLYYLHNPSKSSFKINLINLLKFERQFRVQDYFTGPKTICFLKS